MMRTYQQKILKSFFKECIVDAAEERNWKIRKKMPSEVFQFRSLVIPLLKFSSSSSSFNSVESDQLNHHPSSSRRGSAYKSMIKFPARKLLPLLVFTLSSFSIFRLLRIAVTTSSSPSSSSPPLLSLHPAHHSTESRLSKKEFKLLSNLVKRKAPCNLLIFGLGNQHLKLSFLNSGGKTLFLEDDSNKINNVQPKINKESSWIYRVDYPIRAEKAYELLKHARESPECRPTILQNSTGGSCRLLLTNLPGQVNEERWDVVVVDGPSGDSPEAPGRMSAIYTAGMIARRASSSGKNVTTHVVVHDVHRTIEKWFSWEFLCEENLVSSKGRLWSFEIGGELRDFERFCADDHRVGY